MTGSDQPVYLQLRDRIAALIMDGSHPDGSMLPSVRAFAADNGANPLTVAKAYQLFQDEGFVVVRRGVGMFVADGATERLKLTERDRFLSDYWPRIRAIIDRLGLDARALLDAERA
ncbi:GntR family transcriptional regulator [Sphingomonas jejuensis]|uniref:GntR family transcriptional regulator n=1 Tax=Sphingomonas jejuensis TaxID=904715 RepID=A0ABX0XMX3_9SPHN|nr:GntR family transcriptional regulator [Sphingomonas jejuensis]